MTDIVKDNPFAALIGLRLGSVEFVMDYHQLRFDGGARLEALTSPVVRVGRDEFSVGDPGYRDALCEGIGATVTAAKVEENREAYVRLGDEIEIAISLRAEDYQDRPEALVFELDRDNFWVW